MNSILLMLTPAEEAFLPLGYKNVPPLSISLLSSYLKQNNYQTSLYDLSCRFIKENKHQFKKTDLLFLYDKNKVFSYIQDNNNSDSEIENFITALLKDIPIEEYFAIGLSIGADYSLFEMNIAFLIGTFIIKRFNKPVILGGNNFTYLTQFQLEYAELWNVLFNRFKYIIKGPGEKPLVQLLEFIQNGDFDANKDKIKGLVYQEAGQIILNSEEQQIIIKPDFETLDMSYYDNYIRVKDDKPEKMELDILFKWPHYISQYSNSFRIKENNDKYAKKTIIPYIFNYNCPYNCAFCVESDEKRKKVIIGNVDNVIQDIKYLIDKYESNYFYFLNNAFNSSPPFADALCNELIKQNIKIYWSDCGRFNNLTLERIKTLKEAGCQKLIFGFETASKKISEYIHKQLDIQHSERVLQWCKDSGIYADLEIIIGLPYETEVEFQETVDFINKNYDLINYLSVNKYFIIPSSSIGKYPEKYRIEILKKQLKYDDFLEQNKMNFIKKRKDVTSGFRLLSFRELDSNRTSEDIDKSAMEHYSILKQNQLKKFQEIDAFMYRLKLLKLFS